MKEFDADSKIRLERGSKPTALHKNQCGRSDAIRFGSRSNYFIYPNKNVVSLESILFHCILTYIFPGVKLSWNLLSFSADCTIFDWTYSLLHVQTPSKVNYLASGKEIPAPDPAKRFRSFGSGSPTLINTDNLLMNVLYHSDGHITLKDIWWTTVQPAGC